jgi:hypothetical protein
MRALDRRERKLLALLIVFALFAAAWFIVIVPVAGGFLERDAERDDLRTEYARDLRLSSGNETWHAELEQQKADMGDFAIVGASQPAAATALSAHVKQLVLEAGGTVKSVQMVEGASDDEVRVRANLQLTMEQLYRTLKRIETGVPYVVVEYFSVGADAAFQSGHLGIMEVRLEVSAPYRPADAGAQ